MYLAAYPDTMGATRLHTKDGQPLSTIEEGKWIVCDGEDCRAGARAPVGLHSFLPECPESPHSTQGWLFVHEDEQTSHFCPRCAPHYLDALSDSERAMGT